jgi:hypothetical protein
MYRVFKKEPTIRLENVHLFFISARAAITSQLSSIIQK